jgi:hypothetical protein
MGRNTLLDSGFRNFDISFAKNWHFGERVRAQFRAEFFNILNHPNFANPYGGQNGSVKTIRRRVPSDANAQHRMSRPPIQSSDREEAVPFSWD